MKILHERISFFWIYFIALGLKSAFCEFENQPKIATAKGNLVLTAAIDRNITIRVMKDSCFLINNVNLVDVLFKKYDSGSDNRGGDEKQSIPSQMSTLKSDIRRFSGSLRRVENRFQNDVPARRIRRLLARLRLASQRVKGIQAKLSKNNCVSSACQNGGTCYNLYDDFHCECPDGWSGKSCDEDIDECYRFAGTDLGCQNNAPCINLPGSYRCSCVNGFTGVHCRERNVDCIKSSSSELCGNGVCVSTSSDLGYTCLCNAGWKSSNITPACTVDIDECEAVRNPCFETCINLPGTFMCSACPRGYIGNGLTCLDIDECVTDNGGCSTIPAVQCINTEGSYYCGNCPPGWVGDGHVCIQTDGNSCANQNICHPLATCDFISNTIVCTCPEGMFGNGFGPNGCRRIDDPCAQNQCQNGGICTDTGRTFFCKCAAGFTGNLCELRDPCFPNRCRNGGNCHRLPQGGYRCICPRGSSGELCELLRNTCGSVIRQEIGELFFPTLGGSYKANERCAWLIKTHDSKVLNITFTMFDVESAEECNHDWLQMHDGRSLASRMIGRFCGKQLPLGGTLITSHNQVFLWFRSDNATNGAGFRIQWTSVNASCGGYIQAAENSRHGIIKSPGYPGKSPPNRDCQWELTAGFGERFILRFFEVNFVESLNCTKDSLKIYDSEMLMATICSPGIPEPMQMSSPFSQINFHTDAYGEDSAFQIHYEVVPGDPQCGGHYTAATGTLTSYLKSNVCLYLIQQPVGTKVQIQFTWFNTILSNGCVLQKLEIFDGRTDEDPLVGRWCGSKTPKIITSTSNYLLLRHEIFLLGFANIKEYGYEAKYTRVCGEDFHEIDGGIFTTPNYPNAYYEHLTCTYIIVGPVDSIVHLNITDYSISDYGDASKCDNDVDYVEIFYRRDGRSERYCNDIPKHIVSQNNILRIIFHSGTNPRKARGFQAEYSFETITCGGVLTELQGSFTKYDVTTETSLSSSYCEWILEAPETKMISIDLLYTRSGGKCMLGESDLLIYTNKTVGIGDLIGSYCGQEQRITNTFHTNLMTIFFKKIPAELVGQLTYTLSVNYSFVDSSVVCGGNYSFRYGTLRTPDWPNAYPPNSNCTWIIHGPIGHKIELIPTIFSLETTSSDSCHDDYLEIRNGMTDQSPLVGRYCGARIPPRIPSFTNHLYLHFHSDMYITDIGFSIDWEQTETGCGGHLDSYRGSIHSPNLAERSNGHGPVQCDWRITVSQGSKINLQITEITPTQDPCLNNILTLYDGLSPNSKKLTFNCSLTSNIITIKSSTNSVFVRYQLDNSSHNDQQFLLDYETNCRTVVDVIRGVIESPNFPDNYPRDLACEWDIRGQKNDKIVMTFSHLQLEFYNSSCPYDFVELVDMKDEETLETHRFCTYQPDLLATDGNRILVRFVTDSSNSAPGFRLEFIREGCGGHLTKMSGSLQPPNPPFNVDLDCEWYIETLPGYFITLNISDLNIVSGQNTDCTANALIVSNEKADSKKILHECKSKNKAIIVTSSANTMYIRFTSDSSRSQKHFTAKYQSMEGGCGGAYHGLNGEITSPNYPQSYSSNSHCNWVISVETWHSLVLSFDMFDLPNTIGCNGTHLEIYEGVESDAESKLLLRHCGSVVPSKIYTASSIVNVIFHAGDGPTGKGFVMQYDKACFKEITAGTGIIKSNGEEMCNWHIIASDEGTHPSLTFLHVECSCTGKMFSRDCPSGIAVYAGTGQSESPTDSGHLKTFVCNSTPSTIYTAEKELYIISRNVTFRAQYSLLDNTCGGQLTSLRGVLSSPPYPYPPDVECIWTIDGSRGNYIELTFDILDIVASENCNENYLEIRERSLNGKLLGLFCSNELPAFSLIAFEKFWMKFRTTSNSQVGKGFRASWNYVHLNEISGADGVIESPPIESILDDNDQFKWRITVLRGHVIWLNFKESNQGLTLYDGFDEVSLKVEIQPTPWQFTSSTNVIFLLSDNQELDRFQIEWKAISKIVVEANRSVSDCYENILLPYDAYVNLSSPGYPYGYAKDLSCQWIIRPEDLTQHVVLLLFEVKLEDVNECFADYVKISSSNNLADWHEEMKICNSRNMSFEPIAIIHGTPNIKVDFITDSSVNKTGFSADLITQCGSNLTSIVGTILDYSVINSRITNQTCIWYIEVRPGRQIEFYFDFPKIKGPLPEACENYAVIHDGLDEEAPVLPPGQICSQQKLNGSLRTTSNWATVRYKIKFNPFIDVEPTNLWNLTYREYSNCGGEIRLTKYLHSINVTSPRYPNIPHPHTECVWIIICPPGETIEVKFIERFDMNQQRCNQEFVEFLDGSTALAPSIGRYCVNPGTVRSSGNVMYMRYLTDIPEPRNGFHANISVSTCGGTFTQSSNVLTSVNYPAFGGYPSQSVCDYIIKVSSFSRIALTLVDLHVPYYATNPNSSDHLTIFLISQSGTHRSETELTSFYGNMTSTELMKRLDIDSNEALIRFYSFKANNKFRGFKLKYEKNFGMCYKDVSGESGYLSLDYPSHAFASFRLCRWKITVPKGRRVKLEVLDAYSERDFFIDLFNDVDSFSKIARIELTSHNLSRAILSSDNTMYVRINGGFSTSVKRLRVRYSSSEDSDCPGDIESITGRMSLNALSANIEKNFYCKTNFKLNGRETFTFLIHQLTILSNARSWASSLGVSFRNSDTYELYGSFQSNVSNAKVVMATKRGYISFIQNEALKITHFEGSFNRYSCGGTFRLPHRFVIESPNFTTTNNYNALDCAWLLDSGSFVGGEFEMNVNFTLALPCPQEYISIYSGASTGNVELARICRESPTLNTTRITKKYTLIQYHTDKYKIGESRFRITTKKTTNCGGRIMVPRHFTKSVINFDRKAYKNNLQCVWDVEAGTGYYLSLKFNGRFFIESSPNCTKDFVEILEKQNDRWQNRGKFCGRELPESINTTTNQIRVIFRSDANITADGFTLEASSDCSATFNVTAETQTIYYPRRWSASNPVIHCEYTLLSDSENLISVRMDRGQWGKLDRCSLARLTTFKKDDNGAVVEAGEYCKDNVVTELRARKFLQLVYHAIVETGGTDIKFSLDSCGGPITHPTSIQHLRSENDNQYASNMRCVWNITAPEGHAIVVQVKFLEMEKNFKCQYDYLAVYAGTEISDKSRLVQMCGNLTQDPPIVSVDHNRAIIAAVSDLYISDRGFLASILFTRNCNERITLTTGNSPVNMSRELSFARDEVMFCHYNLMAPIGYRIQVEIKQLKINNDGTRSCFESFSSGCQGCNHLEFFGGEPLSRSPLGRVCSQSPSSPIILSTFEVLKIVASATIPGKYSFEIELKLLKSLCGGRNEKTLKDNEVFNIDMPPVGFTENYLPNIHCSWKVFSKRVFEIKINSLALQEVSDVTGKCVDYVGIQYKYYKKEFCGKASAFTLKIPEDTEAIITFHSNEAIQSQGFHLTVMNKNFCNLTMTETSGLVEKFISDQECIDDILLPENYTIALYVSAVIFGDRNCSINYFQIRDKHTNKILYSRCESAFLTYPILLTTNQIQVETKQTSLRFLYVGTKKPNATGCGGEIRALDGQIVNPPYNDRDNSDCRWDIIMPPLTSISIMFLELDMGSPANCHINYIQILEITSDGKEEQSRRYCGQDNPERYLSENNHVAIVARKSQNFDGTGWMVAFNEHYKKDSNGIIIHNDVDSK